MISFENKTVIVSGGTSGIGLAIARAFHQSNAKVIAAGLASDPGFDDPFRREDLQVSDDTSVERLMSQVPILDVLVNAAGINLRDAEFTIESFKQTIDINLTGVMRMCI